MFKNICMKLDVKIRKKECYIKSKAADFLIQMTLQNLRIFEMLSKAIY